MAANLRIGIPTIPLAATGVGIFIDAGTASTGAATGFPVEHLFGGTKTDLFKRANNYTNVLLGFPLSSALTADFAYVGGAHLLQQGGCTRFIISRNSSNTYGTSTFVVDENPFNSSDLVGPGGDDYIKVFTETAAFQYWWCNLLGAVTSFYPFSKLFFGKSLDLDRDPDEDGGFVTTRTRPVGGQRRAAYAFDVTWSGVSYAKAVQFYQQVVLRRRYQPVVLYTTDYHELLNNARCVLCRVTEASMPPRALDYCDLTARFEELV
jgi:hypothetical protein